MYKDELIKIWRRCYYYQDVKVEDILNDSVDIDCSELLYDTEELIFPEDNNGSATIEIFNNNDELIEDNSSTSYEALQESLKSVKWITFDLISQLKEPIKIYHLPISLLKEVLERENWKMTESYPKEFNNLKLLFYKDKSTIEVEQNVITGETLISKKD